MILFCYSELHFHFPVYDLPKKVQWLCVVVTVKLVEFSSGQTEEQPS
ncbi:hypothetical protein PALB_13650 [Pseudoalteromonas luteoviolacea B = ATCC 29581]|nr:hypothetical protein PALB_13650 [Pseudoalteromonas luteoviolacea B = ATCC 29581]